MSGISRVAQIAQACSLAISVYVLPFPSWSTRRKQCSVSGHVSGIPSNRWLLGNPGPCPAHKVNNHKKCLTKVYLCMCNISMSIWYDWVIHKATIFLTGGQFFVNQAAACLHWHWVWGQDVPGEETQLAKIWITQATCSQCGPGPTYDRSAWMDVKFTLGFDFPNLPYYIEPNVRYLDEKAWSL